MARILALSSQVVSGHVGLSAIQPALLLQGHEVLAVPTILLANHPGQQPTSGTRIEPAVLHQILATLASNDRLAGIDAVLTGYLPSAAHVAVAADAIARCRRASPNVVVLCDPVIGDDPKGRYLDTEAAIAIRDRLLPLAEIITPNRFELAWLSGVAVDDEATAISAARLLQPPLVVATSIPAGHAKLTTLAIVADSIHAQTVTQRPAAPNGTGDLLSALFLAAYLRPSSTIASALAQAVAGVDAVLAASAGHAELQLLPALAMRSIQQFPWQSDANS